MILSEAQALILSWLDDKDAGYFDPVTTRRWLNLAQRQVQDLLIRAGQNWYVKAVETNCVIGQTDYVLPVDFKVENRIELVTANYGLRSEQRRTLDPMTLNQEDVFFSPGDYGVPIGYYLKKDRMTILQPPDREYKIRLWYSPLTVDMVNDSDPMDLPEQFTEYGCIVACFDGFIKDDRAPENLVTKRSHHEDNIKKMAQNRRQDQPRRIKQTRFGY